MHRRQINLAANLQLRQSIRQLLGQIGDLADIGGDILADLAIAPGQAPDQTAIFIANGHRQTINFPFDNKTGLRKITLHAGDEIGHLRLGKNILQAQ
jgi:hypothetical protein